MLLLITFISNKNILEKNKCYFYLSVILKTVFTHTMMESHKPIFAFWVSLVISQALLSFRLLARSWWVIFRSWSKLTGDSFILILENVKIGFEKQNLLRVFWPIWFPYLICICAWQLPRFEADLFSLGATWVFHCVAVSGILEAIFIHKANGASCIS